ncbi:hypothetical protein MMC13_004697 [Lambiella insularis]|nr:hypothetical protein [Lambiella insularis]
MGNIPSTPSSCAARDHTVVCNYTLYYNTTSLRNEQKLAPNNDITGPSVIAAFVVTACLSLVVSSCILLDDSRVLWLRKHQDPKERYAKRYYRRLINSAETLLQAFSDQQLVTGLSLLASVNHQGCHIAAYHYNLVCTMVSMSIVTHLNALINVAKFFPRGYLVAIYRFVAMTASLILTGILFWSRNTRTFPSRAGSLAIMPAACFEGSEKDSNTAFSNAAVVRAMKGPSILDERQGSFLQFTALSTLFAAAVGVQVLEYLANRSCRPRLLLRWSCLLLRIAITAVSTGIIIYDTVQYRILRDRMEVPEWYQVEKRNDWTLGQIVPFALLASSSIGVLTTLEETLIKPRGTEEDNKVSQNTKVVDEVGSDSEADEPLLEPYRDSES